MRSRLAWIGAALLGFLVLVAGTIVGGWYSSPHWLPELAAHYAPRYGVTLHALEFDAPRADGVRIHRLALTRNNLRIDAQGLDITYERQQLEAGRLQVVHVARLDVIVGPAPTDEPAEPLPDPRTLWERAPLDEVHIAAFSVALATPAVRAHGRGSLTRSHLEADVAIDAPAQASGYRLRGRFTRDGQLRLALRTPAPEDALVADIDARWLNTQASAQAQVSQAQLSQAQASRTQETRVQASVRAEPTAAQLQALAALAGLETSTGNLRLNLRTELPWPLPGVADQAAALAFARTLQLEGAVRLDWQGAWPGRVRDATVRMDARVRHEPGSVVVQLEPAMLLAGELMLDQPVALFAQAIPPRFRLEGRSPLRLRLADDRVEVRGRVHGEIGDRRTWVRVDATDADVRVDALANGSYDGLRTRADLDMQLHRTSFDRFTAKAALDIRGDGDAVNILVRRGARLSLGRLGDWTRGATTARATRDIAASVQPTSLRWRAVDARADVNLPRGDFAGTAASFAPAALRVTRAEGVGGNRVDATGSLASTVRAMDNSVRFDSGGTVQLRGDQSHAEISTRLGGAALPIAFVSDYDLVLKRGRFRIADTITWKSPLVAGVLERWQQPGDSARGTLQIDLTADYRFVGKRTDLTARGSLAASAVDATWADFRFRGLTGRSDFSFVDGALALGAGELALDEAFVGATIRAIHAGFALTGRQLALRDLRASIFEGNVRAGDFTYAIDGGNADLSVSLDGIQLAEVLKLQDQQLSGTGTLDGTLPLQVRGNVAEVRGGMISARPPGGTIAYAKARDYAKNIGQPGFEFAISALSDFRYTRMESSIDYDRANVLKLGVKLYGHNPDVEDGRPINYNLNVSQNVLDLLRSLRATDEVSRRLENRLQRDNRAQQR